MVKLYLTIFFKTHNGFLLWRFLLKNIDIDMTFFTRPRLANLQFQQQSGDTLSLSGTTNFAKIIGGLVIAGVPVDASNPFDGATLTYSGGTIIYSAGGGAGFITNLSGGTGLIYNQVASTGSTSFLRSLSGGSGVDIVTSGNVITISSNGGALGIPSDGTYSDGLFPFTGTTTVADAVDDINELLLLLAPSQPIILTDQSSSGSFVSGKLSFGTSNIISGYTNASTAGNGSPINVNGTYLISGNQKGLTQNDVTGILNDSVTGSVSGIPFLPNAFKDGNVGLIQVELNGSIIETIDIQSDTGATSGTYLNLSQARPVRFDNGNNFAGLLYRTGTYYIPNNIFNEGYNYLRIIHSGVTFNRTTNFSRWIFDSESSSITLSAETFNNISLTGSRNISGVKYHTGGNVTYNAIASNVYKNVYSNSATAITYPSRNNLGNPTSNSIVGAGILTGTSQQLPNLNTTTNPQNTDINITSVLPINVTTVIGSLTNSGELRTNIDIKHPFSVKAFNGGIVNRSGFLIYNIIDTSTLKNENFSGEVNRLQDRDYSPLLYANINSTAYAWDGIQSLVGATSQYNTGLLVLNGSLYYPNSSLLASEYGIPFGNFADVTNTPAANVNYTSATGERNHYRKFKSINTTTQSTLTFQINHLTGNASNFLTNGGILGTPSGNNIKFEFLIKRSNGTTHEWSNPFASTGNPEGIANLTISHSGSITTVSCTLSTTPRVAIDDIVITRIRVGNGYTRKINNLTITNI